MHVQSDIVVVSCCMGKPQNTFATITCPFTLYTHEWSYVEKRSICFLLIYLSPFFFLFFLHFLFIYQSILLIKYKHNNTQTYIHLIYINRPQRELKIQLYFHLRNNATSVRVKIVRYLYQKSREFHVEHSVTFFSFKRRIIVILINTITAYPHFVSSLVNMRAYLS